MSDNYDWIFNEDMVEIPYPIESSDQISINIDEIELLNVTKQRYVAFKNHTKITLLANHKTGDYIVIEGSANFNSNPRTEQYVVTNSKELFDFHKKWMEEMLNHNE